MCRLFWKLKRAQGGQAFVLVAFVIFVLVCVLFMTINVGQVVKHKIVMQNAADSAAVSGATWQARQLNIIAACNQGIVLCAGLFIIATIILVVLTVACFFLVGCGALANYSTKYPKIVKRLWNASKHLANIERKVAGHPAFSGIIWADVLWIAHENGRKNGLDWVVAMPYPVLPKIDQVDDMGTGEFLIEVGPRFLNLIITAIIDEIVEPICDIIDLCIPWTDWCLCTGIVSAVRSAANRAMEWAISALRGLILGEGDELGFEETVEDEIQCGFETAYDIHLEPPQENFVREEYWYYKKIICETETEDGSTIVEDGATVEDGSSVDDETPVEDEIPAEDETPAEEGPTEDECSPDEDGTYIFRYTVDSAGWDRTCSSAQETACEDLTEGSEIAESSGSCEGEEPPTHYWRFQRMTFTQSASRSYDFEEDTDWPVPLKLTGNHFLIVCAWDGSESGEPLVAPNLFNVSNVWGTITLSASEPYSPGMEGSSSPMIWYMDWRSRLTPVQDKLTDEIIAQLQSPPASSGEHEGEGSLDTDSSSTLGSITESIMQEILHH